MAEYKHGVYGTSEISGESEANTSQTAIIYVGTAPVHTIVDGKKNVNKPIVIRDMSEALKYLGYSEDWASYTLCEAMHRHLEDKKIGPLVMINVFDPSVHKKEAGGNVSKTPVNGKIIIPSADSIVLDTVVVGAKTKGTDYTISYNHVNQSITISETSAGSLGSAALNITYDIANPAKVDKTDVIGSTDGKGKNTGLYVINSVLQLTGYIPAYIAAPGFSSIKEVHDKMYEISQKINNHWDAYMFVDLPLANGEVALDIDTADAYKEENGYNKSNETVYFPMIRGTDKRKYHLSVLAASNFQELLAEPGLAGVPYRSASNTDCEIIQNLYFGEEMEERFYDDSMINKFLNKNGIASAAWIGGRWALWGAISADFKYEENENYVNGSETNMMMLHYISNDFQSRRGAEVDKPMTPNDIKTIVAQEQARLDALVNAGALTFGEVFMDNTMQAKSDIINGDLYFKFRVTTTPLVKSMTATVSWTNDGFETYFNNITSVEEE